MTNIMEMVKNLGGMFSKNSPSILTGVSVAGLVTTTILGIRTTPKALAVIDQFVWDRYEAEVPDTSQISFHKWLGLGDDVDSYDWTARLKYPTKKEIINLTWKIYLPTIVTGVVTIACIIGANHISMRRNAALASLYGLTEAAFKEYQTKVVETIGRNKELKIRDDISADRIKKNPPGTNEVIITGRGPVLCFDSLSGRYFRSDIEKIRRVIYEFKTDLMTDMFLSLNDLYYRLGLSNIALGDQMGWSIDNDRFDIQFSTQLGDEGEPCLVLNYSVEPRYFK